MKTPQARQSKGGLAGECSLCALAGLPNQSRGLDRGIVQV